MVIVASGAIFQPLIGKLLDFSWRGATYNGIRLYSLHNYQLALTLLPIVLFIAIIISTFFIRETRCIQKH